MRIVRVALVGFGNVGQALANLFLRKREELLLDGVEVKVTGIATGRHGLAIDPSGIDASRAIEIAKAGNDLSILSTRDVQRIDEFIATCQADVLFESIPVNYESGQPALNILEQALLHGMHAITANKGPVVHGFARLSRLAESKGRKFLFESTVMDGTPIFSLFRYCLPAVKLYSITGIFNSTTNFILTRIENGDDFNQAVKAAQELGITETDPSGDIDGWDAAVKLAALTTVLMDIPLKPQQVERTGIRGLDEKTIRETYRQGKRWKLVCRTKLNGSTVKAIVAPEIVRSDSPMYNINGTSSIAQFETDTLGLLTIIEQDPSPDTTAYGLFADFNQAIHS